MSELSLLVVRVIIAVLAALVSAYVIPYLNELRQSKRWWKRQ